MDGPSHYREAERLVDEGERTCNPHVTARAQVHATLALAAAAAFPAITAWLGEEQRGGREWTKAVQ